MGDWQTKEEWNKNPLIFRMFGKKYFVKTPWWVKKLWPSYIWDINTKEKILYLSFDDGPHPIATPFILGELNKFNGKATFFCIGKHVIAYPDIYQRILKEQHTTGNHTYNHLNGWKTSNAVYLQDISKASEHIDSTLFRPPYGRVRSSQSRKIRKKGSAIIMWNILSGDFDNKISNEQCLQNVIANAKPGSIVVFHDNEQALPVLKYTLPRVLEYFSQKGYRFEAINQKSKYH